MLSRPFTHVCDNKGHFIKDSFGRYKYRIKFRLGGRGSKVINRVVWLADDLAAAELCAKFRGELADISGRFTWDAAYELFQQNKAHLTSAYIKDVGVAVAYIKSRCGPCIDKTTLAAYTSALREKAETSSPRRANNIRIYTLSVARHARAEGMVKTLPFEYAPARRESREGRAPFPVKDLGKYFAALDVFARPLFLALAASGERVSAMCGVDISDVNYSAGTVRVIKKGGKERIVPANPMLIKALDLALSLHKRVQSPGAIFINRNGTRWNKYTFRRNTARAWEAAGLPAQPIHSLRNLAATILADANASRDIIAASLGHEQTATADIYVKAREMLKSAKQGQGALSGAINKAIGRSLNAKPPVQKRRTGDAPTAKLPSKSKVGNNRQETKKAPFP